MNTTKTPLITPSASPPPPFKRQKRFSAAPELSDDDFEAKKRASTMRLLDVWSSLAEKWSKPLDEDDIIHLGSEKVIYDAGVLRGSKSMDIGFYSKDDALGDETEPEEDFVADEDESDLNDLDRLPAADEVVPTARNLGPEDEEDLQQFLLAEGRIKKFDGEEPGGSIEEDSAASGAYEVAQSTSDDEDHSADEQGDGDDSSEDELARWDFVEEITPAAVKKAYTTVYGSSQNPPISPTKPSIPLTKPLPAPAKIRRDPPPPLQLRTPPLSSASSVPHSPLIADPLEAAEISSPTRSSAITLSSTGATPGLQSAVRSKSPTKHTDATPSTSTSNPNTRIPVSAQPASPRVIFPTDKRPFFPPSKSSVEQATPSSSSRPKKRPPQPNHVASSSKLRQSTSLSSSRLTKETSTATAFPPVVPVQTPKRPKDNTSTCLASPPSTPASRARSPSLSLPSPPPKRSPRKSLARTKSQTALEDLDRESSEDPLTLVSSSPSSSRSARTPGRTTRRPSSPPSSSPVIDSSPLSRSKTERSRSPMKSQSTLRSSVTPPSSPMRKAMKRKRISSLTDLPLPPLPPPRTPFRTPLSKRDQRRAQSVGVRSSVGRASQSRLDLDKGKGKAIPYDQDNDDDDCPNSGVGHIRSSSVHPGSVAGTDFSRPYPRSSIAPGYRLSVPPDLPTPLHDPRAQYIIAQAVAQIYELNYPSSGESSSDPPQGYPPRIWAAPSDSAFRSNSGGWDSSYPSTPHRTKRASNGTRGRHNASGEDPSSSPSIPRSAKPFETPSRARQSRIDSSYTKESLPPSSPIPSEPETEDAESDGSDELTLRSKRDKAKRLSRQSSFQNKSSGATSGGRQIQRRVSFADGLVGSSESKRAVEQTPRASSQARSQAQFESDDSDIEIVEHTVGESTAAPSRTLKLARGTTPGPPARSRSRG